MDTNQSDKTMLSLCHLEKRAYWEPVRARLKQTIEQAGAPTKFVTFSCADIYWSELQRCFVTISIQIYKQRLKMLTDVLTLSIGGS